MQYISFNDRNTLIGLGTTAVYILAYLVNVLLVLILKIYILLTKGKFGGQELLNYLIKGLFFNVIISMTLEAYIEFTIYGFLNLYTMDGKMSGEILGLIFSIFCIF